MREGVLSIYGWDYRDLKISVSDEYRLCRCCGRSTIGFFERAQVA